MNIKNANYDGVIGYSKNGALHIAPESLQLLDSHSKEVRELRHLRMYE